MKFILNKKAAMFGLDARIALAIFGALSVISGAALYSAIQNAKVVQWQTYFSELNKASEAYYLDTGVQIPFTSYTIFDDESLILSINSLVINEDNVSNWKGPYWQATFYLTGVNDFYIRDNMTNKIDSNSDINIRLKKISDWDNSINTSSNNSELCALNSKDCSEWWSLYAGSASGTEKLLKLFNLLDEEIDNGDGVYSGNVRYSTYGNDYLFIKGRSRIYTGI
jgi:type II secretory pathway pseudopilin PulG